VRLSVNPSVVGRTVSMPEALSGLQQIRRAPRHAFLADESSLGEPQIDLVAVATSRQVTDAHLVNLAATTGCVLATLDRGIPEMLAKADHRHVLLLPA
jgi:predicted nucleic acid-binding protein